MLDHVIDHLELAEGYAANVARIVAHKNRPKGWRELHGRLLRAAAIERARGLAQAKTFSIDPLLIQQEWATWRRLRQYSTRNVQSLTVADISWLHSVVRHDRRTSRNFRWAAEILLSVARLMDLTGVSIGQVFNNLALAQEKEDLAEQEPH